MTLQAVTEPAPALKFGMLSFPVHRPDHDPTIQLEHDIKLAEHADWLGFSEFWFGEYHSGGWRIIADPMQMVARAAAETRQIKLGTGVSLLSYHQPKLLLESAIQLDHLTRGRFMFGVGSDALAVDSTMMGLDPADARPATMESLEAMTLLLQGDTPVSYRPRHAPWVLKDAYLHLMPYSGSLDIRVAMFGSSPGPRAAGRFGFGMLSYAAGAPVGLSRDNPMADTLRRAGAMAARHGMTVDRRRWSAMSPIHIAPTEVEARRQVRYGIARYAEYSHGRLPVDLPVGAGADADTIIDALHASGHGVVGTPAMAVEHIERVQEMSGGIGTFLIEHSDWANPVDTQVSMELFAREVVPHFTGSTRARLSAWARERERERELHTDLIGTTAPRRAARTVAAVQGRLASASGRHDPASTPIIRSPQTPPRGFTTTSPLAPPAAGSPATFGTLPHPEVVPESPRRRARHLREPSREGNDPQR